MRWVKEVFLNFKRSGFMSLISIGTIVITIVMLGAYFILNSSVDYFTERISNRVEVVAFIQDGVNKNIIDNIIVDLQDMETVKTAEFVSKQQAYDEFAGDKEIGVILGTFEENPLPDSIVVKLKMQTAMGLEEVAKFLKSKEGVEDVQYGAKEIENLINIINVVKLIAAIAGGVFILASIMVVSNIIKLTIYNRRQDIYVFQMIGASGSFIRMPFIVEGIIHGFLGGVIGWGIIYLVINILTVEIKKETGIDISAFFMFKPAYINITFLIYAVSAGTGLGLIGSLLSQGRTFK